MNSTQRTEVDPKRKNFMQARTSMLTAALLLLSVVICSKAAVAADFSLAWDPNCSVNPALSGYTIYYSEGSSVTAVPDSADMIYISLDDPDFDPGQPAFKVTGLQDGVKYYFTVTAVYEDGESDMSNEVSGINGSSLASSESNTASTSSGSSGGCFINYLF